jgi:hypothetical protein
MSGLRKGPKELSLRQTAYFELLAARYYLMLSFRDGEDVPCTMQILKGAQIVTAYTPSSVERGYEFYLLPEIAP